jgi:glycosyltransferase involved in cell wall biosynthesis
VASAWSRRIITVSEADAELAARCAIVPSGKLVVVHNGIPDTSCRASPGRADIPVVVMVGRFSPQKDHELLVGAMSRLRETARLALIGDGPTQGRIRDRARALGLAPRVDFLGTRGDVDEILAAAQIAVLASRWEGLPLAVLEAMRAGLPVIASDVGGVSEAVSDGRTGFLVPRGAESIFADRLRRLIVDPPLRAQMGDAGRTAYEARFTSKRMLEQTLAVYRSTLGAP